MKILSALWLTFVLSLLLSSSSEAQFRKKTGDVRGNLRLEVISIPKNISVRFERLNPQALLYHPVTSRTEKSSLVIFLHGSGGSNGSIERFKWKGEVRAFIAPKKREVDSHILVPQSNGQWDPGSLDKLLDYILEKNPNIDSNRVYCIGYSMGGKGTWEWAMASPERFAAVIPKAFIPDLSSIDGMVKLPLWAMVGMKDSKPRVDGILAMEKAFKDLGSTVVKTTYFESANHGSTPGAIKKVAGIYNWLFSHKLPR